MDNKVENDLMVSIIMPVYNSEKYLRETITSVLNQTYKNFELIAIDDCSRDKSLSILKEYSREYENIKVLELDCNVGVSKARNIGIEMAKGNWIQFLDSDDVIKEDMLEKLYMESKSSDFDMIISRFTKEYLNKKEVNYIKKQHIKTKDDIIDFFSGMNLKEKAISMNYLWNRWIKKDIIIKNNIKFDESLSLGEDFVFLCQVYKNITSFSIIELPLYSYIIRNENSLSKKFLKNEANRRKIMYKAFCDCMQHFGLLEKMKYFIKYNEGKYSVDAIGKINYKNCNISNLEKIEYIKTFIDDEFLDCQILYLKSNKSVKNTIKKFALKTRNPFIIKFIWEVKK